MTAVCLRLLCIFARANQTILCPCFHFLLDERTRITKVDLLPRAEILDDQITSSS